MMMNFQKLSNNYVKRPEASAELQPSSIMWELSKECRTNAVLTFEQTKLNQNIVASVITVWSNTRASLRRHTSKILFMSLTYARANQRMNSCLRVHMSWSFNHNLVHLVLNFFLKHPKNYSRGCFCNVTDDVRWRTQKLFQACEVGKRCVLNFHFRNFFTFSFRYRNHEQKN